MKKIIFGLCILIVSLTFLAHKCISNNTLTMSENQLPLPTPVDSVNIFGGWRSKYLESPLYIKNKAYVVFQNYNTRKIIYPDIASFRVVNGVDEAGIAVDKNGVYFQGIFIETDTSGIRVVGRDNNYSAYQWLWKTKNKVFRNEKEISGIDADTFESVGCLNGFYFKDKNYVYYFDKKIEGSHGASVSESCDEFCYDNNQIYIEGKVLQYKDKKLIPVNDAFVKTDNEVIAIHNMRPVAGIDASSLTRLSKSYSMDKNHVYYGILKVPVPKANLKNVKVWEQVNRAYVSDGVKVYTNEGGSKQPEDKLDGKSFGMLPHSDFCYDKDGVYEREWKEELGKVILVKFPFTYTEPVTTENTFITDDSRYIVYCNQAYDPWDHKSFPNLSNDQIQNLKNGGFMSEEKIDLKEEAISLGYYFTKKGNQIFLFRDLQSEIQDVESFEPLSIFYSKDKSNAYFMASSVSGKKRLHTLNPIPGADPYTFNVSILPYDKDHVYIGDKVLTSSIDVEFLAVFSGYSPMCGSGVNETPSTDYIFMKNKDGFWLVEVLSSLDEKQNMQYLGKTFNRKWNQVFEDFEMPSGL